MTVRIEHGDMLQVIPRLAAEGVVCDAVVTDPPYHLSPMHKRFVAKLAAMPRRGVDGAHRRLASGFMGQQWDGGDIAFRPETWATVATLLRPGAFLVAFGGTRTYHRLVCAIEDGGFVIQDQIAWLFATGFPKRRDMLKPAYEPIVLAYKPGGKRTMQINECRIGTTVETWPSSRGRPISNALYTHKLAGDDRTKTVATGDAPPGRWPANVAHDGSDEVLQAFPDSAGQQGDVSGTEPSECFNGVYNGPKKRQPFIRRTGEEATSFKMQQGRKPPDNGGSAARFFFSAKAGSEDRFGSRHPTVKPVELMKWLVALVCPPGGLVLDPFAGSGTTGVAALATGRNAILIEREDAYAADILERMAHYEGEGRHSLASKARHVTKPRGETPLFDPPYDPAADARGSYDDAVHAVGERVKAGEPTPPFFLSDKAP